MKFKIFLENINELESVTSVDRDGTDSSPDAMFKWINRKPVIELYPKFYKHPAGVRKHILFHELGHWFREAFVSLSDIMGWKEGENFFIYNTGNSEEGFAEAFASFFTDSNHVKKNYPEQYERLKNWIGSNNSKIINKVNKLI